MNLNLIYSKLCLFVATVATTAAETAEEVEETVNATNIGGSPIDWLFTGAGLLVIFIAFAAPLFLAAIPANIAGKKGRNFGGYYVFGYFALIPAIIVTLVQKPVEKPDNFEKRSMKDKAYGRSR